MVCPPIPVYCRTCGSKLKPKFNISYDPCDGKQIKTPTHSLNCANCQITIPDHTFECVCGITNLPSSYRWLSDYNSHLDKKTFFSRVTHRLKCVVCELAEPHIIAGY